MQFRSFICIFYGNSHAITAELTSCNKGHLAHKKKIRCASL